jgi:hypothetical protein
MSNSDWFSRKLGNPVPQQPQQAPQYAAPQPATYAQPQQPQYPPSQQATPQAPRCPGCGSGNYGSVQGATPRCYDCGYPLQQSGSGLGKGIINPGQSSAGPATPARQVPTGTFNGTKPAIGADGGFIG